MSRISRISVKKMPEKVGKKARKKRTRKKNPEERAAASEKRRSEEVEAKEKEAERAEGEKVKAEPREPLSVYDLIAFSLKQFEEVAWQKLGLRPDPMTGKIEKDLEQSRIAIDIAGRLAEALDPHLDDEDKREIQNVMSNLRINYVRIQQEEAGSKKD